MGNRQLVWCFKLKDGLRIAEPNERLSKSYLEQAKSSLLRAEKDLDDNDSLWVTVAIYYAEYYALYSFLQRIGVKCENHACSILAASLILGKEKTNTINEHKGKRIDAQYYMKVDQEIKVRAMLQEAKTFVSDFDEIVSNLSEGDTNLYRHKISEESNTNKNDVAKKMKDKQEIEENIKDEEDSLWEKGAFVQPISPNEIEGKMRTFHKKHNEYMDFNCRKCNTKISTHNKDWHDGMCDDCFNKKYH